MIQNHDAKKKKKADSGKQLKFKVSSLQKSIQNDQHIQDIMDQTGQGEKKIKVTPLLSFSVFVIFLTPYSMGKSPQKKILHYPVYMTCLWRNFESWND